jgi:hypothetical protein
MHNYIGLLARVVLEILVPAHAPPGSKMHKIILQGLLRVIRRDLSSQRQGLQYL